MVDSRRSEQKVQSECSDLERSQQSTECSSPLQLKLGKVIAHGTFGMVYEATEGAEETVAVKRVYQDKKFRNREL